ncbi:phosphoribosylformylglycinamidine synthase subunit PurL [Methanogenium organophilum]|uniref:Phosphoribosylformylglycinamidine synthase subunit PurL n=1 Tax=Methanogenium organophilum TaxID=2199 RepID=A0A9X9S1W8_METOG|nr:phosphoribosylformylglycinamidine synthase subunit PurL [Methanogenium organophilum]WAI00241.1 phosphoribosylformylglycinamidine synthase subunit PurL [Methanogenium organophilum]
MVSAGDLAYLEEQLKRPITPLEYACFENLWSEHCSYRSTKAFLKTLPTTGENVLLGPGDDAAIVKFSDDIALAIGMESHNHPSYVDPYDGAATGVGGIVRDIISMGAKPIALMDPLYFGPITEEKNRYLLEHVVQGIGDYGNCIGVPVVRGEVRFDERYSGNPLVNVVSVGIVDPEKYLTARVKKPGNRLVLYGASTGRDGLGGASFASRDLSEDAEAEDRPCVQVGDPYTEKLLIDATLEMAATGKVVACRDLGAAGLAGASSEMSSSYGARIEADRVHLRETGMNEVEIMLAESQERMLMEVAEEDIPALAAILEKYSLQWRDIGEVLEEKRYLVTFEGNVVCDLPIDLLVEGAPGEEWASQPYSKERPYEAPEEDIKDLCLAVLSHPDVARKDWISRQYDHDVQLRTVSVAGGAGLLRLGDSALSLSCGCSPRQIELRPYEGAANTVFENAANLACVGSMPLCIVNCLNFASPVHPEIYWQLGEAVRGMGDMATAVGAPVVGGNVSLYNESDEFGTQILPTPSIGMAGKGPVLHYTLPGEGATLAIAGSSVPALGGSVLDVITGCGGPAPNLADPSILEKIRTFVRNGGFAIDISTGGLIAAIAECAPKASVTLAGMAIPALFDESPGRFLIAYTDETVAEGLDAVEIGTVGGDELLISVEGNIIRLTPQETEAALGALTSVMYTE